MSSRGSRELTSDKREKMMYERMKWIEKQIETLTTMLQEIREERRGAGEASQ